MEIDLKDLQELFEILISKAINAGFEKIDIDSDFYQLITSGDRENFSKLPVICTGSLVDDMESLKKVLEGSNPATTVDIDRLANVLISISNYITNSDKLFI
jgi:hypothetical protein